MCYVGDDVGRQKSDPKWRPGVFLGKTASNDMFIIHLEGNLRLTRSVKLIFPATGWKDHIGLYRTVTSQPWHIEGVLGNRSEPVSKRYLGHPSAVPLDDEAAAGTPYETGVGDEIFEDDST